MTPWKLQYVLAHGFRIATWGGAAILTGLAAFHSLGTLSQHADTQIVFLSIVAVIAAVPLGWMGGAMTLWPFLGLIGNKMNGAPFRQDDLVRILVGVHRDRVARVYEVWASRHQVRVELGEREKKDVTDVFMWNQICREKTPIEAPPHNDPEFAASRQHILSDRR